MKITWKENSVLPGFGPTFGFVVSYLTLIVLVPVTMLFVKTSTLSGAEFWGAVTASRVLASYRLSFGTALAAAAVNALFGLIVAWVLVRYRFPGRGVVDMLVDLPFALPTAVAGIALTTAFSEQGAIGKLLSPIGLKVAFTPLGIIVALIFIGLPFVVRTIQPVLKDLDKDMEEAAVCLGARRWQIFVHVILPAVFPALMSGFAMAFARGLGEYGSVVFIAGNIPMQTEITPLLILTKLEQYDYAGATAIAAVMLSASFAALFIINRLQWWSHSRQEA